MVEFADKVTALENIILNYGEGLSGKNPRTPSSLYFFTRQDNFYPAFPDKCSCNVFSRSLQC